MRKRFMIYLLTAFGSTCVYAQERVVDVNEVYEVVDAWTEALNEKDLATLSELYAGEVIYYGRKMPKDSCLEIKAKLFESSAYFHQSITNKPVVEALGADVIRASLVIQVTSGAVVTDHEAYLLIKRIGGELRIIGESDLMTDGKTDLVPEIDSALNTSLLSLRSAQEEKGFWRSVYHVLWVLLCGFALVGLALLVWKVRGKG